MGKAEIGVRMNVKIAIVLAIASLAMLNMAIANEDGLNVGKSYHENGVSSQMHMSSYVQSVVNEEGVNDEENYSNAYFDFNSSSQVCNYIDGKRTCKRKVCEYDQDAGEVVCNETES